MKSKAIFCALLSTVLMMGVFTGCSNSNANSKVKSETKAFTAEEIKATKASMSASEKEQLVYSKLSDSVQVDKSKLLEVSDADKKVIESRVEDINTALRTGKTLRVDEKTKEEYNYGISEDSLNYMLLKFASSPYSWRMSKCSIEGMDAPTRLYFVDVEYTTTAVKKTVIPKSIIVMGEPDEEIKLKKRMNDYTAYLSELSNGDTAKASKRLADFERVWGKVDSAINSQNTISPMERASMQNGNNIGAFCYAGENADFKAQSATLTFRFVFGYNYNTGEEADLALKAVYQYNYETKGVEEFINSLRSEVSGKEIFEPLIKRLVYTYMTAVDENNDIGLYSLFSDYSGYDKYYYDYDNYTYHKNGSYIYELLGRSKNEDGSNGDKLYVLVRYNSKERAKGSSMSQPSYSNRLVLTVKLRDDDKLGIDGVTNLDSEIIGEPKSVIENVTGVSEQLLFSSSSFTETNDKKSKETLKNFLQLELTQNFDSSAFTNCVDLGIDQSELEKMQSTISAISANEMAAWIVSYNTKSNSYISVNLREVYLTDGGKGNDTESTIELLNRNGKWSVISYVRTVNVEVKGSSINEKGCFEHYKKDGNDVKSIKKEIAVAEVSDIDGEEVVENSGT